MISNILIVCVGNICRSPMGAALFAKKLDKINLNIAVHSSGLAACVGKPAEHLAQEVMRERKLDISTHRATQLSPAILFNSDIIFAMSTRQQRQIEYDFPSLCGRVHRLGKWGEYDIPDPYRRSKETFEIVLELIKQGVEDWCEKLWK